VRENVASGKCDGEKPPIAYVFEEKAFQVEFLFLNTIVELLRVFHATFCLAHKYRELKSSLITGLMRSALPSERSAIFPPEKNTC
jgi:hypothetical protein